MKLVLKLMFSIFICTSVSYGRVSPEDSLRNEHMENHTPIYVYNQTFTPRTFAEYLLCIEEELLTCPPQHEFSLEVINATSKMPPPWHTFRGSFLGYTSPEAEIAMYSHSKEGKKLVGTFPAKAGRQKVEYVDDESSNKHICRYTFDLEVRSTELPIRVRSSGKYLNFYENNRALWINVNANKIISYK